MAFDLEDFYDLKWPQLTEIWNFIFPWRNNRSHKDWFWRTRQLYLTKLTKFSKRKIKNSSQNVKLWNSHYPTDNKKMTLILVWSCDTWHSEKIFFIFYQPNYDGDRFEMLVTESLHVGDFFNVKNRLQTPQISHQQKMSPTPVSNIDVTHIILKHIGHLTVTFRIAWILGLVI